MGNPVTALPYYMYVVKDLLENLNIQNFGHYLVIPYSDHHLRRKAMADYLYVIQIATYIVVRVVDAV